MSGDYLSANWKLVAGLLATALAAFAVGLVIAPQGAAPSTESVESIYVEPARVQMGKIATASSLPALKRAKEQASTGTTITDPGNTTGQVQGTSGTDTGKQPADQKDTTTQNVTTE